MSSRRFRLVRHHDVSGVSGTGPVAEGVQFTDGAVALRWYGDYPTTTVWDGIESVVAIHGHGGATVVEWLDPEPGPDPDLKVPPRETLPPRPWPDLHAAPEPQDPDPLHPDSLRSDSLHSDALHPDARHPDALHPDARHPDALHPDPLHPDARHPDPLHPDPLHPDALHPDSLRSDSLHSDRNLGSRGAAPPSTWSSYRVFR